MTCIQKIVPTKVDQWASGFLYHCFLITERLTWAERINIAMALGMMLVLSNHSVSIQQLPAFLGHISSINSDYSLILSKRIHVYRIYCQGILLARIIKHQSSMVGSSSLSPDVEKLITDPEVLRVLRLFISLGRTDIIKFLNETVNQDPKEVQNALDAVYFFVKRGLRTQRYLTSQMRTDAEPSEWPYDPNEESSFTSAERKLVDKYPDTGLTYRAWNTVNICPPDRRLWDRNSKAYESQRFCAYSRLQFVIFYPGLVNLAFLEQGQADVLARAEAHFDRLWARNMKFRKTTVDVTRSVLKNYGSVDDGYTNYDGLLTKEELAKQRKVILVDFDAQRDAMLNADASDFREFSHAGWWFKYGRFWSPGNSVGSILHSNKMLVGKNFRDHCNLANDSKEIRTRVATRAVRHYGLGYVPTKGIESRSRSLSNVSRKKTGAEKEERERSRDRHRQENNQNPPRDNRNRRSSLTRSESLEQQRQESKRNTVEARAPAKKSDNGKKAEAKLPAKESSRKSKKPAAKTDPSSSRTGGSGEVSRSYG
ncbi:predicted protein [Botrytis cinerea T4]|uniref:Uncharacterized protein n=1 Tax=Botryotinia fuckeliana (strain T4) TaxID=999810 RepID=G2YSJ4_BOTF4|nr:predicted protein [Botrytis cinerea T4]